MKVGLATVATVIVLVELAVVVMLVPAAIVTVEPVVTSWAVPLVPCRVNSEVPEAGVQADQVGALAPLLTKHCPLVPAAVKP